MRHQTLPVYDVKTLLSFAEGKVRFPHGVYNCGIRADHVGIVRSCTINARQRLGHKALNSHYYGNCLYRVQFDEQWNPTELLEIKQNGVIHDVRMAEEGPSVYGCRRHQDPDGMVRYHPVQGVIGESGAVHFRDVPKPPMLRDSTQKNWTLLGQGESDCSYWDLGFVDQVGSRCCMEVHALGKLRWWEVKNRIANELKLRGGTNPVNYEGNLLTAYHQTVDLGDGFRSYYTVFAIVQKEPPFKIVAHTPPLKMGEGEAGVLVQFPIGLVVDGKEAVVSYGVSDADNYIARISLRDVMNLML